MLKIYPEKHYPEAVEFCKRFVQGKTKRRYVMGRNEYAVSIAECVDIDGFIDDFTTEKEFLGKSVYKLSGIPPDSMVVSSVIFVVPFTALRKIQIYGLECLDYFKFLKYSELPLKTIDYMVDGRKDIETNFEKYQWLYDNLHDDNSKNILIKLLNFRVSGDLNYMIGFENLPEEQYFENFLELKTGEVFIDAGGYDGQTSIEFIRRCPDFQSIHFFEPDFKNLELAKKNLSKYKNIHYYTMGLAENKKTLRFSSGGGSASKINDKGNVKIEVDSIDRLIKGKITFVKMDIEGAEEMAIHGVREHILQDHPKLAISCYHKVDDLWKIPEQILAIRGDYQIYLRHYTDGLHETVMFFIP